MKHIYILLSFVIVSLLTVEPLMAQQEVMIRELNTYNVPLTSQDGIPEHPLIGTEVTFDAVVIAYPRNSGLATPNKGDSGAEPGRIHLFVTDVNAVDEGEDGMSMQIVVEGAQRTALEQLFRGDVIRVVGSMSNFSNTVQFNVSDVESIGDIYSAPYTDLAPLLEPEVVDLSEINQPSEDGETHRWVAENYSKYAHRYIKLEGLQVVNSLVDDDGRPWVLLTDGNTVIFTSDMSLRYRNDRGTYGYLVEEDGGVQDTVLSLGYNYRREIDGNFTPPPAGSVVDISGYYLINPSFDPEGVDESMSQSVVRIIPWEDGIRWTADGDDIENRITTGIPNDFEVLGFAPILDNFAVVPDSGVANDDAVEVSIDVALPEQTYTLNSVEISYSSYPYTANSGEETTVGMTANGNTYSHTFGTYDDFTTVKYSITATAETPDGVITTAVKDSMFVVESDTQAAPVMFSRPAGSYNNSVEIHLSTVTPGATIYYTLDGTDPDETSSEYTSSIQLDTPDETTTIKAIAVHNELSDSPINERTYSIALTAQEFSTLADLRNAGTGIPVQYTGNAVVTYTQSNRNQKYIQDETAGILIDDSNGNITSAYSIGDVMTGLLGELGSFNGVLQFIPSIDPGASASTDEIVPEEVTLDDIDLNVHESMLVKIKGVTFAEADGELTFSTGSDYDISDASLSTGEFYNFRTNFYDADYIDEVVPTSAVDITAIVAEYNGSIQVTARSQADIEISTSNEMDELPIKFALEQNYPNPFNPTTVIRYSVANVADVQLQVYDILGRKVATLVNELQAPGSYSVNFDASMLGSGTYFYRIEAGNFTSIKKMMLIK